jgi:hypothetical protein
VGTNLEDEFEMKEEKIKDFETFVFLDLVVLLIFLFMLGIWAVDIGASAMLSGGSVVYLFGTRTAVEHYHIGLVLSQLSFFTLSLLFIFYIILRR